MTDFIHSALLVYLVFWLTNGTDSILAFFLFLLLLVLWSLLTCCIKLRKLLKLCLLNSSVLCKRRPIQPAWLPKLFGDDFSYDMHHQLPQKAKGIWCVGVVWDPVQNQCSSGGNMEAWSSLTGVLITFTYCLPWKELCKSLSLLCLFYIRLDEF